MRLNFLFVRKYNKNRQISTHSHDAYEFVYYLDGKGSTTCAGQTFNFYKDSFMIIPPNTEHSESHVGRGHILAIGFDSDKELNLDNEMYNGFDPKIYSIIQKMKIEFIKKEDFYEEIMATLLSELMLYLKRSQKKLNNPKSTIKNDISFAVSYLNEYFMTDINLDELAQSTGYCKDHFRILFKKHTGKTPKTFILEKKLSYAKKLLTNQQITLTDVSNNCGFEYYSCFCGFFKKKTGMTPLEYRTNSSKT